MKKLLLLALAACLPFSMAAAQGYHIYYGTIDGSDVSVGIDRDIEIPCWLETDASNTADSVAFMHNPLASDDLIITSRAGGFFGGIPGTGHWDDISFLPPDADPGGFTNQSVLGFCDVANPPNPQDYLNSAGGQILIATYEMHTVNNAGLIGTSVVAFQGGDQTVNHTHLWGNQFGTVQWIPTQHYANLFFSPNADPVWTVYPGAPITAYPNFEVCFALEGTDADLLNTLTITGPYGFSATGTNGLVSGTFCHTYTAFGTFVETFELNDGTVTLPIEVTVNVVCGDLALSTLEIGCISSFPGGNAMVPINLSNPCYVGGFELLVSFDPTALSFNSGSTVWTARTYNGSEYHNQIVNAVGPGTVRFVYISDVNNGVPGPPIDPGTGAVLWLSFGVNPSLPFGMYIPINFLVVDYGDNTISDETGYEFIHPGLTDGCVETANPDDFRGDPNMNCFGYEIADAVLVAQRLIQGYVVWAADDAMANILPCTRHFAGNDGMQEAASDLNGNGFCDIADLVGFINIINNLVAPKLDPATGVATVTMGNGSVSINSGIEVGAVLVRVQGEISSITPNGMEVMTHNANGVTSVLVYSIVGERIPAGNTTLFTYQGEGSIVEVSAADAYGRLLDASARLDAQLPTEFAVKQNYPNPFNAKTMINFALTASSDVTINIYNITGQVVETINGRYEAGFHSVNWDAANVASGIYFAKVAAGDNTQTVKMTLLK
jgi:hypothetical protein